MNGGVGGCDVTLACRIDHRQEHYLRAHYCLLDVLLFVLVAKDGVAHHVPNHHGKLSVVLAHFIHQWFVHKQSPGLLVDLLCVCCVGIQQNNVPGQP